MLRRLVSSSKVEFKKPPAQPAPEPEKPVARSGPFIADNKADTAEPDGENASQPAITNEGADVAPSNGGPANGGGLISADGVARRNVSRDDVTATRVLARLGRSLGHNTQDDGVHESHVVA